MRLDPVASHSPRFLEGTRGLVSVCGAQPESIRHLGHRSPEQLCSDPCSFGVGTDEELVHHAFSRLRGEEADHQFILDSHNHTLPTLKLKADALLELKFCSECGDVQTNRPCM
jgi:hypothetical protein